MTAEDDDYEQLPPGHSVRANAAAGACAGLFEHIAVYPMDIVRTQYQAIRSGCRPSSMNPFTTITQLYRKEGLRGTFRGSGAVMAGCGPAHAFQFSIAESVMESLGERQLLNGYLSAAGVGGIVGALAHDLWMNPCDVVKQRLQVKGSPYVDMSYPRIISDIYRAEGLRAFYLSFPVQLMTNLPFSGIQFSVYHWVQREINPNKNYDPAANAAAGAAAGGLAAFVTTPLDVIKTVLNTQERLLTTMDPNCETCPVLEECKTSSGQHINGIRQAIRTIADSNPASRISPFFRGCLPRTLYYAPGTALSWLAYEFMKSTLNSSSGQKTKVVDPLHHVKTVGSRNPGELKQN